MKRLTLIALLFGACLAAAPADRAGALHRRPGLGRQLHPDEARKIRRLHEVPALDVPRLFGRGEEQGLVLDTKFLLNIPRDANDWDIAIATLYPSFAKALDFNQGDEDKRKAIAEKQFKTKDEDKQQEMIAPRLFMRDALGTRYLREVNLKPLP